ncbi:MAG TPA: hypothetical protein VG713_15130 [Pirellulales bacterium]|nr:hypothetical protein [Pirellulales bacterium]
MQSRLLRAIATSGLISFSLATIAWGQQGPTPGQGGFGPGRGGPGGPGRGPGSDLLQLLALDEVQKELKITPKQKEGLAMFAQQVEAQRQAMRVSREDLEDLSDQEREAAFAQMRQQGDAMAQAVRQQLQKGLQKPQMDRLDQISLQLRGSAALEDPTVIAKLKLTDKQKQQIEQSRQESRAAFGQMFQAARNNNQQVSREEMGKKFDEMREQSTAKVMAILSPTQQEQFEKMKGEPFEIDRSKLFGGRGPGGPPGQNPTGNN